MPLLDRLIWQIETNLDSELSLPSLSDYCAVNIHHICRAFQAGLIGNRIRGQISIRCLPSRMGRSFLPASISAI